MTNHDYSFSVAVPVVLPEGSLSKEQQFELIEEVRKEALAVAKEYIDRLQMAESATVGDGYILFPDHRLVCSHEHPDNPRARLIAAWAAKPMKEDIAGEVEYHYEKLHRKGGNKSD